MGFGVSGCMLPANRASQTTDAERAALFCLFYFPSALQTDALIKSIKTNYWENEIKRQRSSKTSGPNIFIIRSNRHKIPLSNRFQTVVLHWGGSCDWTPSRHMAMSGDIFGCRSWGEWCLWHRWRPGVPLKVLQCPGWTPHHEVVRLEMSLVPMLQISALKVFKWSISVFVFLSWQTVHIFGRWPTDESPRRLLWCSYFELRHRTS